MLSLSLSLVISSSATPLADAELQRRSLDGVADVQRDGRGRLSALFGEFDIGVAPRELSNPAVLQTRFHDFFDGLGELSLRHQVDHVDLRQIDDITTVLYVGQQLEGIPVLDGDLAVVFNKAGHLTAIVGLRVDPAEARLDSLVEEAEARAMATAALGEVHEAIRFGWSVAEDAFVFEYHSQREQAIVSATDGSILSTHSLSDEWGNAYFGDCTVRGRDFARNTAGQVTSLGETASTVDRTRQCMADEWWGTNYWHLKRQNTYQSTGYPHQVGRIQDADGGELEVTLPVNSTTIPAFTNTNGDALREQGAFLVQTLMRFYTLQNMWDDFPPEREADVQITVDDASVATAQFDNGTTDIKCNSTCGGNCCSHEVLAHEYGHYVVWSYGDFSEVCTAGLDEGDSLDETLANSHALLYLLDDQPSTRYGATAGNAGGNFPAAHTSASGANFVGLPTCPGPNSAADGRSFNEALWEILFNRDCALTTCGASDGFGSGVFPAGTTQEEAIRSVGRALASAQTILGTSTTHQAVRGLVRSRIATDHGTATATNVQRIFSHHGYVCPGCCTGC